MTTVVRQSSFRHVFAEPWKTKWDDIRLSTKVSESTGIRANGKYVAVPWGTGGGGNIALML